MPRSDSCCLPRNTIRPARIDPAALHSPRDLAAPAESAPETRWSNHSVRASAKTRSAPPSPKNCTDCCRSPAQTSSTLRIVRARSRKKSLLRFGSVALRALVLGLLSRSARAASKQTDFSRTLHHSAIPGRPISRLPGHTPPPAYPKESKTAAFARLFEFQRPHESCGPRRARKKFRLFYFPQKLAQ